MLDLSVGKVASTRKVKVLPKKYPKYTEFNPPFGTRLRGGGIVPVCVDPNDPQKLLFLFFRKNRSKNKDFEHLYDFGGRLANSESLADVFAKKLSKKTFGLFAVDFSTDSSNSEGQVRAIVDDLFGSGKHTPVSLENLSVKWVLQQIAHQPWFSSHINESVGYAVVFLPVLFRPAELLNACSLQLENGKRNFYWLSAAQVEFSPLAPRLNIRSFQHVFSREFETLALLTRLCQDRKLFPQFTCFLEIRDIEEDETEK